MSQTVSTEPLATPSTHVASRPRHRSDTAANKRAVVVTTVAKTVRAFLQPHIAELERRGWTVSIASSHVDAVLENVDNDLIEIPFSRGALHVLHHAAAIHRFRRYLRDHPTELIYTHTTIASALSRVVIASLPRRHRPKVLYFAHGFPFLAQSERGALGWLWYTIERILSRWTDAIIVNTRYDRDSVSRWPIAQRGDVYLLPGLGFDPTHYALRQHPRSAEGHDHRQPRVLYIAEVIPRKRHELLLAAMARVNARLTLLGYGTDSPRMRELVAQWGLSDRVDCVGSVTDVRPFMEDADVTALFSKQEGLSRSLLESLAMGTPIVVTPTRGARELADLVGCPVAAAATPEAVAEAIRRGLQDRRPPSEIRARFLTAMSDGTSERVVNRIAEIAEDLHVRVACRPLTVPPPEHS